MNNRARQPWTDSIPDSWRLAHFGAIMDAASAPDNDADGDGLNNLAEFKAGTSPEDISSTLKLTEQFVDNQGSLIIGWKTVVGKHYRLESSETLQGAWTLVEDQIPGTGGQMMRSHQKGANPKFYRVSVID
jgi:hypothetical protein